MKVNYTHPSGASLGRAGISHFQVTLSERNLRDLLAQLASVSDEVKLGSRVPSLVRYDAEAGVILTVVAEHDDRHYANREAGPGSGLVS